MSATQAELSSFARCNHEGVKRDEKDTDRQELGLVGSSAGVALSGYIEQKGFYVCLISLLRAYFHI